VKAVLKLNIRMPVCVFQNKIPAAAALIPGGEQQLRVTDPVFHEITKKGKLLF